MIPLQAQAIWSAGKLWILGGLAIAILALGFMGGLRWQKGAVESAKRARDNQANVAQQWKDRAEGLELAVNRFTAARDANEKAAKAQREQAARILEGLAQKRAAAERAAADWQHRYNQSKSNPDCAQLQLATKCPAFYQY